MAYPTGSDLKSYVQGAFPYLDFTTSPGTLVDFDGAADAGVQAWESQSGYIPFLADTSDQTLYYSPRKIMMIPNEYPILEFGNQGAAAGMVSVTSVTVGLQNGTGGTVLTLNKDYTLVAVDASTYTGIQFTNVFYGFPTYGITGQDVNSIKVVGKRGYRSTLLASERNAILAKGAQVALGQLLGFATGGGVSEMRLEGAVTEKYDLQTLSRYGEAFNGIFKQALSRFGRTIFS